MKAGMSILKKILIVDDNEMLLDIAKQLLAHERYEIITHPGGAEVIDLVSRFQPDLVLLDINMPELPGDALAMLLRAKEETRHIRIVFYSSNDENSLKKSVSACGVQGYICKGEVSTLRSKIDEYLR
jgi:CheY-like chemotaxis protein